MCSGIAFLIGLYLLFKGDFRFAERYIPREKGRAIALILMAPVIIGVCAGLVLLSSSPQSATGTFDLSNPALGTATLIEIGALVIALGLVAYNIYTLPKGGGPAYPMSSGFPAAPSASHPLNRTDDSPYAGAGRAANTTVSTSAPPAVMTMAEAAAYLRTTEEEVLRLIETSKLGAARVGDSYRVAKRALDDFLSGDGT